MLIFNLSDDFIANFSYSGQTFSEKVKSKQLRNDVSLIPPHRPLTEDQTVPQKVLDRINSLLDFREYIYLFRSKEFFNQVRIIKEDDNEVKKITNRYIVMWIYVFLSMERIFMLFEPLFVIFHEGNSEGSELLNIDRVAQLSKHFRISLEFPLRSEVVAIGDVRKDQYEYGNGDNPHELL